jgi:Kae1-associated kinase Bud32
MKTHKILQQGAEALIILKDKNEIIKRRVKKSYRLPQIDEEIRKLRTRSEGKLLEKASKIIHIPHVIKVDEKNKEIIMDFISGKKLSENLDSFSLKEQKEICKSLGSSIAKLHDIDIIHGDLTTSNMIYVANRGKKEDDERKRGNNNFKIFFIDFGLGFQSHKIEDKAVDLHLLRQALEAKHFKHWQDLFKEVLKGYESSKNHKSVLNQFKKVESRGRYKDRY